MTQELSLRARAETLGQSLPPLLAAAEHLSATVILGEHGRRRAGMGDEFWQYRPAHAGDSARMIDWRRSARAEQHFVREREWQAAQSVTLWVDTSRSMAFTGDKARAPKADRAQLDRLALALANDAAADYGAPVASGMVAHGRAVFLSDFLGDLSGVEDAMARASDKGVRGMLVQVLDPAEESFPFDGRTIFESMGGSLRHETLRAGDLKARYLARLAERKDRLATLGRASGWHFLTHHTGESAQAALLWLYRAMERGR
ncbi:MAG: hypothetical protein RLZZ413_3895 [Pseudomonadota bacterium]